MGRRMGLATLAVLRAVASGRRYGFEIMDVTDQPSGTVYPALSRLEDLGYVRSRWEDAARAHAEKRPPRRYYQITGSGEEALEEALAWLQASETGTAGSLPREEELTPEGSTEG